ncbi:hypothetical protein Leryth_001826 [Lithospermum erythrorhizon]|nr:hypothetical protein Leryth_001826 [Lithospermum erythrorhizon]
MEVKEATLGKTIRPTSLYKLKRSRRFALSIASGNSASPPWGTRREQLHYCTLLKEQHALRASLGSHHLHEFQISRQKEASFGV